nr:hypothetical protein [Tanacetum cinerariifolium]
MHSFNSSREITNSSICTFPRVEFPSHDLVVHHSGHDIKKRVKVNVSLLDMHVSDIARDLKVSSSLVGKVSKYSTTSSFVVAPSTSGSSLRESSSFGMISINITSPSSSLVQMSLTLGDGGTNLSDSKNELNLRTFSVRNDFDGSGGVEELEWLSGLSLYSSSFSLVLSSRESLCSLGWIMMALIELFKLGQSSVLRCHEFGNQFFYILLIVEILWTVVRGAVVSEQDVLQSSFELDFRAQLDGRFFGVEVMKLTTDRLVNGSSYDGLDMVIKNLDLEPKDIIAKFYGPSWWKELSKELGSKILTCGDGFCWKAFKPIASMFA